jgi:pyridoxine 5-phosphate synthase
LRLVKLDVLLHKTTENNFFSTKKMQTENYQTHTRLSVNINKFATLRNSRGKNNPNLLQVAQDCLAFGAEGITVHPRPDERHIRYSDVPLLREVVGNEFNIEGKPSQKFNELVLSVRPDQVTLVPDADNALTSNSGWDTLAHGEELKKIVEIFKNQGIRVSIFIDPIPAMIEAAALTGTDRIELYTEFFAENFAKDPHLAIKDYIDAAKLAHQLNLGINAGHDLSLKNLSFFKKNIPYLQEVSIGHALVCDALYLGLENTIRLYQRELGNY